MVLAPTPQLLVFMSMVQAPEISFFMAPDHRRRQKGTKGAMPPTFLENIVILHFDWRFSKQMVLFA